VTLPPEELASSSGPAIARALRAARLVVLAQRFPAHSA
jgi:hypothetical protein